MQFSSEHSPFLHFAFFCARLRSREGEAGAGPTGTLPGSHSSVTLRCASPLGRLRIGREDGHSVVWLLGESSDGSGQSAGASGAVAAAIVQCREVCRFAAGAVSAIWRRHHDRVANLPHVHEPFLAGAQDEADECARIQPIVEARRGRPPPAAAAARVTVSYLASVPAVHSERYILLVGHCSLYVVHCNLLCCCVYDFWVSLAREDTLQRLTSSLRFTVPVEARVPLAN